MYLIPVEKECEGLYSLPRYTGNLCRKQCFRMFSEWFSNDLIGGDMWNEGGNRLRSHQSIVCCTRCRLAKRWWGVGKPEEKYRIGLLPDFKETTHPFPGLRTGFVTAVGKTTLGEEAWEPLVQVQFPKYSGWNQHWYLFQIVWVGWCPAQQQQPWGQSWRRTWTTSPCSL